MIQLLLHTLTTSTPVKGDVIVYWQNRPKYQHKPRLIDATTLTLDEIHQQVWSLQPQTLVLVGIDLLLPLKQASVQAILLFIRSLSRFETTVILNSDDALRTGDHEVLLTSLAHSASSVTALRALPSGRDKEYAGLVRVTRGITTGTEGERLYRYQEQMMNAII